LVLALLAAVAVGAASAPLTVTSQEDSLDAIRRIDSFLRQRYRSDTGELWARGGMRRPTDPLGRPLEARCDGDRDDVCFADDFDGGPCPTFVQCHPSPHRLVEALLEATREHPGSGYLAGQAVYLLGKLDRLREAMEVVDGCRAAAWWCEALGVYVLHAQLEDHQADVRLDRVLEAAPDSIACAYMDATWILGKWDQRGASTSVPAAHEDAESWDCARRLAFADTLWWLSDPLYSAPGNERRVAHFVRSLSARFQSEIRRTLPVSPGPQSYRDHLWAERVRRGPVDSYDSQRGLTWTSRYAARYHFVPDVGQEGLDAPAWRLEASLDDEGFRPAVTPFLTIPWQVARFRSGDSLGIAVAAEAGTSDIADALDAAAALVLTDGPRSVPLHLTAAAREPTTAFLARAPAARYVVSLEVVTSKGVGWQRAMLASLRPVGAEISDLLLHEPREGDSPTGLLAATSAMLGSTTMAEVRPLGLYWETYGAPAGETLAFDLSIERRAGGLVERLRRILPGRADEARGRLSWTETAAAPTHVSSVNVDLGDLGGGDYTLVLSVRWNGQEPIERRREFRVGSE